MFLTSAEDTTRRQRRRQQTFWFRRQKVSSRAPEKGCWQHKRTVLETMTVRGE